MAVAIMANIGARVCWLIGARLTNGTYSLSTADDDRFDDTELKTAIIETESELVADICEAKHSWRGQFLALSAVITNGGLVPEHDGQIEEIWIEPYSGAGYITQGEKTSRTNIRLWRENPANRYDAVAHSTSGSKLAGYYALDNETLTYTGFSAKVMSATYVPDFATYVLQITNKASNALVVGAIPKLYKFGLSQDVVSNAGNLYGQMRNLIRQGSQTMPEIEMEQKLD
jgi:hypothetical protein